MFFVKTERNIAVFFVKTERRGYYRNYFMMFNIMFISPIFG